MFIKLELTGPQVQTNSELPDPLNFSTFILTVNLETKTDQNTNSRKRKKNPESPDLNIPE